MNTAAPTPSDIAELTQRHISPQQAKHLAARLEHALHDHPDRARVRDLLNSARTRAPQLLAALGLVLIAGATAATPVQASVTATSITTGVSTRPMENPTVTQEGRPRSVSIRPTQTSMSATAAGSRPPGDTTDVDTEDTADVAKDMADEIANLAEILGYTPPSVSIDDLEQFIQASFITAAHTPYRTSDPDQDTLDRGIALPVIGTNTVNTRLAQCRNVIAAQPHSWPEFPHAPGSSLEQQAWEAFQSGDTGNFRFLLFAALESAAEMTERLFVLSLAVSLDSYDEELRQSWLDRIREWREGQPPEPYQPAHTQHALEDFATANHGHTMPAAAARLFDSYLRRVLDTAQAGRVQAHTRWNDPRAAKTVQVSPNRETADPDPRRHNRDIR